MIAFKVTRAVCITRYFSVFFHTDGTCEVGWSIQNREGPDSSGWTMVSPDQRFLCNGQVTEWRYQGKQSNAFRAIVWRQVEGFATQFQVVGINGIPAGAVNTLVSYTVPENDRITVNAAVNGQLELTLLKGR